jgi:hypothetical protein
MFIRNIGILLHDKTIGVTSHMITILLSNQIITN